VTARLRVVVADDERPARSFLVALLRSFEDVTVVGEAASGKEAVAIIEKERPDVAFLDWQMPELDGMGVVRQLRKQSMPLIAFVTAYDEYAVRAFEVNAVDYLLKPVDKSRLRETLNRAQDRMEHEEIAAEHRASAAPFLERIPVRHRHVTALHRCGAVAHDAFTHGYRARERDLRDVGIHTDVDFRFRHSDEVEPAADGHKRQVLGFTASHRRGRGKAAPAPGARRVLFARGQFRLRTGRGPHRGRSGACRLRRGISCKPDAIGPGVS
jgi:CheY-like chemotaxis protein